MSWWTNTTDTVGSAFNTATLGVFGGNSAKGYTVTPSFIDSSNLIDQIQQNAVLDYSNTAASFYSSMQENSLNPAINQFMIGNSLANAGQGINANTANQVAQTAYQSAAFNAGARNSSDIYNSELVYGGSQAAMNRLATVYSGVAQGLGAAAGG